jgi:hypothetical protein
MDCGGLQRDGGGVVGFDLEDLFLLGMMRMETSDDDLRDAM